MKLAGGWIATTIITMSASNVRAQERLPTQPSTSAASVSDPHQSHTTTEAQNGAPPPPTEFLDANGNPLPKDVQRQLEEEFKKTPPPAAAVKVKRQTTLGSDDDITVTGSKLRGSVVGTIPPERTFSPLDIKAYGASNIGELLQSLGPQVSSSRGREDNGPVTLLNGRRISNFSEISRIPPEAIERLEVFPEELALRYGYRADQKVTNIVLFEHYRSRIGQVGVAQPTDGNRLTANGTADYFAINGDVRLTLGADYSRSSLLRESDRDVVQLTQRAEDARSRTLLPQTDRIALNGLVSGTLLGAVSSSLNGRFEENDSKSLLGPGVDRVLTRNTDTQSFHLGTSLNGRFSKWIWSFTGNYDRVTTNVLTDSAAQSGARDEARSHNNLVDLDLLASGPLARLPAGPITTSLQAGVTLRDFRSTSRRDGIGQLTTTSRNLEEVQVNIDVPLFHRRADGHSPLGNLTANANLNVEGLSDFGTLRTVGYGLNWSPVASINVVLSRTDEQGAPTLEQLRGPVVVTPNVRTFDFVRRETVDVTRIFGGNPNLRADDRSLTRVGIYAKPWENTDLTLNLEYTATTIDRPISSFPILTSQIEDAFPERFTRDSAGELLRIDTSPVNFERSRQKQLRLGFNFTRPLGSVPPGAPAGRFFGNEAEARRSLPPGGRLIVADPSSPLGRRLENMTSRFFVSLYDTWFLQDEILINRNGPTLDLLNGDAVDFGGGRRRHQIELQAGAFKRGLGARVTADWRSGTTVQDAGVLGFGDSASDLRFQSFGIVNINLFVNLGDWLRNKAPGWLKRSRLTLGVTNLFNTRPQVRDSAGRTPLSYQPAYLDPIGRAVSLNFRKII
jgi:hypothetical protein